MLSDEQFGFNAFWWERLHTEDEIKACVDSLANIGYRHVEFKRDSFVQERLGSQFKIAVEIAEDRGLSVSNFVVLRELTSEDPQEVNDVIDTIVACSEAGVHLLNTVSGEPPEAGPSSSQHLMPVQPSRGPAWGRLIRALEKICKSAEENDVTLALEPCVGLVVHDYDSTRELFDLFDHDRLGLTLDPSHFMLYRNDLPDAIRNLGSRIKHVHLKDAIGRPGSVLDFMFPMLGSGGIDWMSFFQSLDEIEYRGVLSAEYEQFKYMNQVLKDDPVPAARETYFAMTALFEKYHQQVSEVRNSDHAN